MPSITSTRTGEDRPRLVSYLRFVAAMAVFSGIVLPLYREEILGPLLAPLTRLTAAATAALLQFLGMQVTRVAATLYHPDGFACEIIYSCTGFLPAAFLTAAVLFYPAALRRKMVAGSVALPALLTLNLLRLVHLFHLGVNQPLQFELAHLVHWEAGMLAAVFAIWLLATRWMSDRRRIPGVIVG